MQIVKAVIIYFTGQYHFVKCFYKNVFLFLGLINATPTARYCNFRILFDDSDYVNSAKKRLKPSAVPSGIENNTRKCILTVLWSL